MKCSKSEKEKSQNESYLNGDDEALNKNEPINARKYFKMIIIDFSSVTFIDEFGVKCLQKIKHDYNQDDVKIVLTCCNSKLRGI